MSCQLCGYQDSSIAAFCTNCGQPQFVTASAAVGASNVGRTATITLKAPGGMVSDVIARPYAPFTSRFLAFVLDEFIAGALAVITYFLFAAMSAASGYFTLQRGFGRGYGNAAGLGAGFLFLLIGGLVAFAVYIFYFVKQESGPRQATFGKALFGLKLTTPTGSAISVGQSLGRLLIKSTFSGLFFALGFLMAAFTERKQALHDFVANSIVVQA